MIWSALIAGLFEGYGQWLLPGVSDERRIFIIPTFWSTYPIWMALSDKLRGNEGGIFVEERSSALLVVNNAERYSTLTCCYAKKITPKSATVGQGHPVPSPIYRGRNWNKTIPEWLLIVYRNGRVCTTYAGLLHWKMVYRKLRTRSFGSRFAHLNWITWKYRINHTHGPVEFKNYTILLGKRWNILWFTKTAMDVWKGTGIKSIFTKLYGAAHATNGTTATPILNNVDGMCQKLSLYTAYTSRFVRMELIAGLSLSQIVFLR